MLCCLLPLTDPIVAKSPVAAIARCLPDLLSDRVSFQIARMESPTYQIDVSAESFYLPEQSDEDASRYFFAYTIKITNTGSVPAQLISRHWIITDANERVQEVRGDGVVGEQPRLEPGEVFEYTSSATIETPVGTMRGSYQMVAEDGEKFDAAIPEFTLSIPRVLH
jgi:ApaG protein